MTRLVPLALIVPALVTAGLLPATPAAADPATAGATVVSFAGGGVVDGPALSAALYATSAAYGPDGTLYLADLPHNRVRAVTGGSITTVAGSGALTGDEGGFAGDGGPATSAALARPSEVAVGPAGDVFVLDSGNRRVRRIDHATGVITTVAGNGQAGTPAAAADATTQPLDVADIAVSPTTGALVLTAANRVWSVAADGALSVLAGAATGDYPGDGPAASARFQGASGIAFTPDGALLVADTEVGAVRKVADGVVSTVLPTGSLFRVSQVAAGAGGVVYAASSYGTLQSFSPGGSPSPVVGAPCDGVATSAAGVPVVACGSVFAQQPDGSWARVAGLRKARVNTDVTVDGTPAAQAALEPTSLTTIGSDVYVSSYSTVDRVGADGLVHRVAGTDDVAPVGPLEGPAAQSSLLRPYGTAPAPSGGLFLSDNGLVRLRTADGVLHAYTGTAPVYASRTEGEPASAVPYAYSLAAEADGDLWFGAGDVVGRVSWADRTVHYATTKLEDLGGPSTALGQSETVDAVALDSDGTLLVLSTENDTTRSRVRRHDATNGTWSTLYNGPGLTALTVVDGTPYVATRRQVAIPAQVARLGDDGSVTVLAGGGTVLGATQSGAALGLPDVSALAPAPDGGLLVATTRGRRVLEVQPGFSAPVVPAATGLVLDPANHTLSWTAPSGLPAGATYQWSVTGSRTADLGQRYPGGGTTGTTQPLYLDQSGYRYVVSVYVVSASGDASAPLTGVVIAPGDTTAPTPPYPNGVYSTGSTASFGFSTPQNGDFVGTEVRLSTGAVDPDAAPVWSGTSGTVSLTGLTPGQKYFFTAVSRDYSGNRSYPVAYSFTAGASPLIGLDGPADGSFTGSSVTFTPKLLGNSGESPQCTLDGAWFDCAFGPYPVTGLAPGQHVFTAQGHTTSGDGPVLTRRFTVDATAPTVTVAALPAFTLGTTATAVLGGADSGSGVASWNIRYQRAAATGGFSAWTTKASSSRASVPLTAGYTTCVQAQSKDRAGNLSAWSPSRCTTRPLDDRGLTASAGWARTTAAGTYLGTLTTAARTGVTLTKSASFKQIALVATTCPTCGSVNVYVGSTLVRTVSLVSSATVKQKLLLLPVAGVRTGTVSVKTLSTRSVQVDGIGFARA